MSHATRRDFLAGSVMTAVGISVDAVVAPQATAAAPSMAPGPAPILFEELIRKSAVSQETIDLYIKGPSWAQFDAELGYVRRNYVTQGGINDPSPAWNQAMDKSTALSTVQANGARTSFMYAGRRPRINAYGDSFTECMQVSDGETWEEYLAAHLGEPIGNFGVGGYGVYQAYRRMLREERSPHGASHVILYIWGDDPIRSLNPNRWAVVSPWAKALPERGQTAFHGGFWPHVEMDLSQGVFVEKENPLRTVESLHHLTDPEWLVDQLKADLAFQLYAFAHGQIRDLDRQKITRLAEQLEFPFDWAFKSSLETASTGIAMLLSGSGSRRAISLQSHAKSLLNRYAQRATLFILNKARSFARQNNKKLLVVLNDTAELSEIRDTDERSDKEILDYLIKEKIDHFDMNEVHWRDYQKHNEQLKAPQSYKKYVEQFRVNGTGHYSPLGNHFFAYSIKDKVTEWLDTKPIAYRRPDPGTFDFKEYLERSH